MNRRQVMRALVAAGGTGALAACLDLSDDEPIPTGDPATGPVRQHAWNDRLRTDEHGNHLLPRHHVFLSLEYAGDDPVADRDALERTLLDLERAYESSSRGLLFTVGYSPMYFDAFDSPLEAVDLPPPEPIVPGENVALDEADLFVHLASDRPEAVLGAEEAMFGADEANGIEVAPVPDTLATLARRTGFVGPGMPAERDDHVHGVPDDAVEADAPFYSGFPSGFRGTQATEDRVTITDGRFAGGTTEHVSILRLLMSGWFAEALEERVGKLFSPDLDAGAVGEAGANLTDHSDVPGRSLSDLRKSAREHGVVGHAEKLARFREDGRPPILRRDVNSDDGGEASIVFVSLQRAFEDFRRLRLAMEGADVVEGTAVGPYENGILQYIQTRRRGNFLVPPRDSRAFPL